MYAISIDHKPRSERWLFLNYSFYLASVYNQLVVYKIIIEIYNFR